MWTILTCSSLFSNPLLSCYSIEPTQALHYLFFLPLRHMVLTESVYAHSLLVSSYIVQPNHRELDCLIAAMFGTELAWVIQVTLFLTRKKKCNTVLRYKVLSKSRAQNINVSFCWLLDQIWNAGPYVDLSPFMYLAVISIPSVICL